MASATTQIHTATYSGGTASMQVDPEARHGRGAASASSLRAFPIDSARCATYPTAMEWVPDRERAVVPDLMAALCRRCPGRQACLLWALAGPEQGYWAATTTDRATMLDLRQQDLHVADQLQALARQEAVSGAQHPPGQGSHAWYRRRGGCRCGECRSANSAKRADERAKAKAKARATIAA